jgi:3-methyladenine DNA glycosylase AlkD
MLRDLHDPHYGRLVGVTSVANHELVDRLRAEADPARAVAMRAYMRDQFPFLGISSPRLTALVREMALPKPTEDDLRELALFLWAQPEREFQYVACGQLRRHVKVCGPDFLAVARELIVTKSWWDTVDTLASHTVGPLVRRHPSLVATMDAWIGDQNIWLARTAILHQLGYKDFTDAGRLFRYCAARAEHPDFFIRKAIGWALREYTKTDPAAVRKFVRAHESVLSGLSKREALRKVGG